MCAPGRRGEISFFSFLRIPPPAFDAVGWCPKAAGGKKVVGGKEVERYSSQVSGTSPLIPLSLSLPPSLHLLLLLLEFFQY